MSAIVVTAANLHKSFNALEVLKGIDLEIAEGERIAILGASGSGKSTLLRCLNFMERPSDGRIHLDGSPIGKATQDRSGREQIKYSEAELCRLRMNVGMVFQNFNLFPHLTALENVMEALVSVKRQPKAVARATALAQLTRVNMSEKADSYPINLSGGQQQRVAIARALAMAPRVLLLDEPTSSLDPELVGEVLRVINDLVAQNMTMVLVTHELGFAYHFASRVIFLHDGKILEEGTPDEILKYPKQKRTQEFLAGFSEFKF
jgi:polar amino acid transport system ATP-binding protein